MKDSDFRKYQGVLKNVEISEGFGKKGSNYAILLTFQDSQKYGIYSGTEDQASLNFSRLRLTPGTKYRLFIDETVSGSLGIRKITKGSVVIYKENMKAHKVFGYTLIVLGVLSSVVMYRIGKNK